nr:hypothetical protein [Tanacetum cinerariifolium]
MIGSLMYLTSSRPDIINYAGASLDRKSTIGGCQFLGCRLISWKCKKQTIVATSSNKAEYVAAASCCAQVLWIQNQLMDYGKELASPKQTALGKDISNLFMAGVNTPRCDEDSIKLMELMVFMWLILIPTIYVSCIKQFWATATIKKVNDVVQLRALINGKKVVVSEDVIRRDFHLDDTEGVECLPNEEIFLKLTRMGYEKPPPKLTFYKAFFSTQWKFLIHTLVQCLSAKRTAWNEFSCSMASAVICLTTCRKFNFSKYIFDSMVRNIDSPSKFLMYPRFLQVVIDNQVDDMTSYNTRYASPALTQKVFANMRRVGKGFLGVETPLFASVLVQPQPQAEKEEEVEVPITPAPPSPTSAPSPPLQDPTPTPHATPPQDQPSTPPASPPQEQPTTTFESSISLLTTLIETYVNAASKGVSTAEPTVFDDEEVTMTMAQTLIKMKAEKSKLLNEQMAQKLHDEEVQKAAARDKQEKDDMERAQVLQKQYDDKEDNIDWNAVAEKIQERHLDNIKKYQSLKKKPVSIAQARKNMIIYLKNMARYKMEHFRGMTYDKVRTIFEREYKKVQTLFKPDKDVEEPKKKRVADETLLQESFKKLRAVKVSGYESTQEIPSNDLKEMSEEDVQNITYWKIIRFGGITEAYQSFKDKLKGFDREDLVALWNLVKEKFSSAVPSVDKEKALWVELKRLFEPDADDVL